MSTSVVSICNMALGWIGVRKIAVISENTPEGRACATYYDPAREQTLRDHAWNFAETRVTLASLTVPAEYTEYGYAYAWPTSCLRAIKVFNSAGVEEKYKIVQAADLSGRMILTNASEAVLVYTANVENPSTFDPLFARALARRVAADICPELLKGNMKKAEEQETYYFNEINKAQARDSGEGETDEDGEDDWVTARFQ